MIARLGPVWEPWRNVHYRVREVGEVAVREGQCWVEVDVRVNPEKWFRTVHVLPRAVYQKLPAYFWRKRCLMYLDQLRSFVKSGTKLPDVSDPDFAKAFPALCEYMTVSVLGDGQLRTPSSLTLFCEDGEFKACLSERDHDLSLWGTGSTFNACMRCLESRLTSANPDWRRKGGKKGAKGK